MGAIGVMGVMGWVRVRAAKGILNSELGISCKLAPAGGVSHTGNYATCRTSGTSRMGREL